MTGEYLYRIRPTRLGMLTDSPTDTEAEVLSRHVAYLERLAAAGTVVLAGRTQTTDEETHGIVVFRASDDAAAEAVMQADPAVKGGVMTAELFPYRIAAMAPR